MRKTFPLTAAFFAAATVIMCTAGAGAASAEDDHHCKKLTSGNQCAWTVPGTYEWTVPKGVNQLHVVIAGGQGGGDFGGAGGYTEADFNVTPGEKLQLNVGGRGKWGNIWRELSGGFNGGGEASDWMLRRGVGGGGGTDIRSYSADDPDHYPLTNRFIVVGGGGGGSTTNFCRNGGEGPNDPQCLGGGGGGVNQNGGDGSIPHSGSKVRNAHGATPEKGGLGASAKGSIYDCGTAPDGTEGQGGEGHSCSDMHSAGNGGGGGKFGGGGSIIERGAGGGSGYGSPEKVTNVKASTGAWKDNDGNGEIIITPKR